MESDLCCKLFSSFNNIKRIKDEPSFQNNEPCGTYLCKKFVTEINFEEEEQSDDVDFEEDIAIVHNDFKSTLTNIKELVSFDFHVLFHLSYGVPYICFNVYKSSKF